MTIPPNHEVQCRRRWLLNRNLLAAIAWSVVAGLLLEISIQNFVDAFNNAASAPMSAEMANIILVTLLIMNLVALFDKTPNVQNSAMPGL